MRFHMVCSALKIRRKVCREEYVEGVLREGGVKLTEENFIKNGLVKKSFIFLHDKKLPAAN